MTNSSTDVALLQLEVLKKIRDELTGLRTDVTLLRTEFGTGLGAVRSELQEGLSRMRTEIAGLRGDLDVGFTTMRLQDDRRFLDHERRLRELEAAR